MSVRTYALGRSIATYQSCAMDTDSGHWQKSAAAAAAAAANVSNTLPCRYHASKQPQRDDNGPPTHRTGPKQEISRAWPRFHLLAVTVNAVMKCVRRAPLFAYAVNGICFLPAPVRPFVLQPHATMLAITENHRNTWSSSSFR